MAPPPSTPAPHRFLVPKRSATQRDDTPKQLSSGSHQFRATPRFSLHSTPHESTANLSSSTPARVATVSRHRLEDSISDIVDSSPPDLPPSKDFSDSIEAESIPPSSFIAVTNHGSSLGESDFEDRAPSPKRRRLSVSSGSDGEAVLPLIADSDIIEDVPSQDQPSDALQDVESAAESDEPQSPGMVAHQPTFHRAPRFMQIEQPEVKTRETLPDAFSPRRRGTKDVPGGLAAELRNWLIDIEAKTGPKSDKDFIAKLYVEGFRRGQGMVLINGQTITDCAPAQEPRSNPSVKVMLAGEGRLLGLARRNEIRIGSHVTIAKPTWEVNMGIEGRWVVACDWVVS